MKTNIKSVCEIVENIEEKLADYKKQMKKPLKNVIENVFLNGYIPTIPDENLNLVFTRRLYMLQCYILRIQRETEPSKKQRALRMTLKIR